MYLRLSASNSLSVVAVLGISALWTVSASGAETTYGRPIEFSQPKHSEVATNLNQFNPKRDGLSELEEDLFKPFKSFSPASSLDGVVVPPNQGNRQVIQSRRARELRDRKKKGMLDSDWLIGAAAEDLFKMPEYGPDGKEKKPEKESSRIEKFYQRLERETLMRNSSLSEDDMDDSRTKAELPDDLKDKDDTSLSQDLNDPDRALHRLFNPRAGGANFGPDTTRGTFSDIFGLGNNVPSTEQLELRKANNLELDKLLGASPASSLPGGLPAGASLDLPGQSLPAVVDPNANAFNAAVHAPATTLPDLNAKSPAATWNTTPASLPKVDPPKLMTSPSPLDFPHRKF